MSYANQILISIVTLGIILILALIGLWQWRAAPQKRLTLDYSALPQRQSFNILSQQPDIVRLEEFMTPEECRHVIKVAEARFTRSPVQGDAGVNEISKDRTSSTANLKRGEDEVIRRIEERASRLTGIAPHHWEPLQVVKYEPGQYYKPHYDYFPANKPGSAQALARGGGGPGGGGPGGGLGGGGLGGEGPGGGGGGACPGCFVLKNRAQVTRPAIPRTTTRMITSRVISA
jgi:uncharacterized membrane protein YgcG